MVSMTPRENGANGLHSNGGTGWRVLKLLHPGVGVKRWMLVGGVGIGICAIGLAYLLRKLFALQFPDFLPGYSEGVLLLIGGLAVFAAAVYGLYRSVGPLVLARQGFDTIADAIYTRRARGRGPRVVVVGGGTGLSVLLRGLKAYTDNLTAIVTVADDGGSSGRLRRELGVPPPGDFRNCLVALSDAESLMTELFQHRFQQGDLKGHSFGNLFIAAMTEVTGSFEDALRESSRVLAVHGEILPATTANLTLCASLEDGSVVRGESAIGELSGRIARLSVEPSEPEAYAPAVQAISQAQFIVVGPGSLFTSVLPNLLVPGIARAVRSSAAPKVYVCNVATQRGETDGYAIADHVSALQAHTFPAIVDYVVANRRPAGVEPPSAGEWVVDDGRPLAHAKLRLADVVDPERPVRHDSDRLVRALLDIYRYARKNGTVAGVQG